MDALNRGHRRQHLETLPLLWRKSQGKPRLGACAIEQADQTTMSGRWREYGFLAAVRASLQGDANNRSVTREYRLPGWRKFFFFFFFFFFIFFFPRAVNATPPLKRLVVSRILGED